MAPVIDNEEIEQKLTVILFIQWMFKTKQVPYEYNQMHGLFTMYGLYGYI